MSTKQIETLRSRIALARQSKGMKQSDLADKTGLPQSQISKFESGNTKDPSFATVLKISNALDLPLEILVEEEAEVFIRALSESNMKEIDISLDEDIEEPENKRKQISIADATKYKTERRSLIGMATATKGSSLTAKEIEDIKKTHEKLYGKLINEGNMFFIEEVEEDIEEDTETVDTDTELIPISLLDVEKYREGLQNLITMTVSNKGHGITSEERDKLKIDFCKRTGVLVQRGNDYFLKSYTDEAEALSAPLEGSTASSLLAKEQNLNPFDLTSDLYPKELETTEERYRLFFMSINYFLGNLRDGNKAVPHNDAYMRSMIENALIVIYENHGFDIKEDSLDQTTSWPNLEHFLRQLREVSRTVRDPEVQKRVLPLIPLFEDFKPTLNSYQFIFENEYDSGIKKNSKEIKDFSEFLSIPEDGLTSFPNPFDLNELKNEEQRKELARKIAYTIYLNSFVQSPKHSDRSHSSEPSPTLVPAERACKTLWKRMKRLYIKF